MDLAPTDGRVTITALAAALGVTEPTIRYRVKRGQLTPPDAAGLFDLARARREPAAEAEHIAAELEAEPRKVAIALERIIHKHLEAWARATFTLADEQPPD